MCLVVQSDAADDGDVFRRERAKELLHFVFLACLLRLDERGAIEDFDLQTSTLGKSIDVGLCVAHDGLSEANLAILRRDIADQTIPGRDCRHLDCSRCRKGLDEAVPLNLIADLLASPRGECDPESATASEHASTFLYLEIGIDIWGEADVYTGEVVAPQQPRTEAQGCRAWVVGPGELRGAVLTRQLMEKDAAPDDGQMRLFRKREFIRLMWPMVKPEGLLILVRALRSTCNRGQVQKIVVVDLELWPTCRTYSDIAVLLPVFASAHAERDKDMNWHKRWEKRPLIGVSFERQAKASVVILIGDL